MRQKISILVVALGILAINVSADTTELVIGVGVGVGLPSKIKKDAIGSNSKEIKSGIHVQPSLSILLRTDVTADAGSKNTSGVLYGLEVLYSGGLDKKDQIELASKKEELGITTRNFVVLANAGYAHAMDDMFSVYVLLSIGPNFYTMKNASDGLLKDVKLKNTSAIGFAFGGGFGVMVNVTEDIVLDVSAKFYKFGKNKIESGADVATIGGKLIVDVENQFPAFAFKVHYKLPL